MKNNIFSALLLLLPAAYLNAQAVSINTDASNPDPSAILDVKSTEKGMLVPRMSTAQRKIIAAPATGLLVFDTDAGSFWFYNGTAWTDLSSSGAPATFIADTDGNTKVQTEATPNEDMIRFSLGGAEQLILRKNAGGTPRLEVMNSNTFVGNNTGAANTTGFNNVATGCSALFNNTTGAWNTANGFQSLYSNTTGGANVAIGPNALYSNTTGSYNTASSYNALYSNITGYNNTANSYNALYSNTTGFNNTASGSFALFSNTTGYFNTANGADALHSNTTGYNNTANGFFALFSNTTGYNNTANGVSALYNNTTGSANTANGYFALYSSTLGYNNTGIGENAGSFNDANTFCTFIGNDANQAVFTDFTNATALGNMSRITASDQVRVGNSAVTSIGGFANWTNISDRRFKQNIRNDVPGLAFITRLQPVTYNLDVEDLAAHLGEDRTEKREAASGNASRKPGEQAVQSRAAKSRIHYTGFVAQDVEAAAQSIGYDFSGVDKPKNEAGLYGLRYAEFTVPLVQAVQEQQAMIEAQAAKIEDQAAENAAMKAQLDAQAALLQKITAALQTAGIGL